MEQQEFEKRSKEITKSYLDELIEKKAEESADNVIKQVFSKFYCSEIDGNGNKSIVFNDKCGELAGVSLYSAYETSNTDDGTTLMSHDYSGNAMLEKYTNWKEVRQDLINKFKKEETHELLSNLKGIQEFIDSYEA